MVELRLSGAGTPEGANEVVARFLPGYNRRFRVAPREPAAVWRKAPPAYQLDRVLCLKEWRVVGGDHTVSFEGLVLQHDSGRKYFSLAGRRVEVLQLRDGSVEVHHDGQVVGRFTAPAIARLMKAGPAGSRRRNQAVLLT